MISRLGIFFGLLILACSIYVATSESLFDFSFPLLNGELVKLSNYNGSKVILVVNVASECPTSYNNFKNLRQLYQNHNSSGLEILGIVQDILWLFDVSHS